MLTFLRGRRRATALRATARLNDRLRLDPNAFPNGHAFFSPGVSRLLQGDATTPAAQISRILLGQAELLRSAALFFTLDDPEERRSGSTFFGETDVHWHIEYLDNDTMKESRAPDDATRTRRIIIFTITGEIASMKGQEQGT